MGNGCISSTRRKRANSTNKPSLELQANTRRKEQHLGQNLVEEVFQKSVFDVYDTSNGPILGTGISGAVRTVYHKETRQAFAMKALHIKSIKDQDKLEELQNEVRIMAELDHPNIIRLFEVYQSSDHLYLIMELCTGGELLDRLNSQVRHQYSEKQAMGIVRKIISAVRYLHGRSIVHRDLKLENFIFENASPESELKLIDFGLSRHFTQGEEMHMPVGTPFYVAPEVLRQCYTEECDMWSIGVISYMLVSGRPPFMGIDEKGTLALVKKGRYKFPKDTFETVSEKAIDFIRKLLIVDPMQRMSAEQAQQHPWVKEDDIPEQPLNKLVLDNLVAFNKLSAFQKLAHEVIAFALQPEQVGDLREEFRKFDKEGTGELTLQDMRKALEQSSHLPKEACERIFDALNIDNSGKIHWVEFLAATMQRSVMDEANLKSAFDRMDRDSDGFISEQDIHDLVGIDMSPEQIREMFGGMRSVRPGQISLPEFMTYMREDLRSPVRASVSRRRLINFSHGGFKKIIESGEYTEIQRNKKLSEGHSAAFTTEDLVVQRRAAKEKRRFSTPAAVVVPVEKQPAKAVVAPLAEETSEKDEATDETQPVAEA